MEDARSRRAKVLALLLMVCVWLVWGVANRPKAAASPAGMGEFAELNRITRLKTEAGESVGKSNYIVRRGDTLLAIARQFQVSLAELIQENGIDDPDRLQAGQTLVIKSGRVPEPGLARMSGRVGQPVMASRSQSIPRLAWPLQGKITQGYGLSKDGDFHHGLDVAGEPGGPIRAAAFGKVIFSGWKSDIYGRAVVIDHGNELVTLYSHNNQNLVAEGEIVAAGQVIATVGSTGRTTGPHLHFEVRQGASVVNPLAFLQ